MEPSVLVGRARELGVLDRALRGAQNGAGRCLLLSGEAGIGKSRLATELRSRATDEHWTIWQGHCSEQDVSFPYSPWIDALRAFLGAKSATETGELLGPLSSDLVKVLPELSLLDPAIQPTAPLEPQAEKHRLFESFARFAVSLATAHPLLIVLKDLHWSDEPSLDLLHFFARRIAPLPILLIGTYRIEELPPRLAHCLAELDRDRLAEEIRLAPLAPSELEAMVHLILRPEAAVGPDLLSALKHLTEGNPFFIEELLKSLPPAGGLDTLQIPRSIQDAVQRRVDRLSERTRKVLALGAVLGDRFDFGLMQGITSEDELSLLQTMKELIAADLLVEESADQFAFRHALTREAVYASLMQRERRALHRTIAETLERMAGSRDHVPAAQLAFHFYQAQVWPKALAYSQRAGEQAQQLYAPREALAHFTRASDAAQRLSTSLPTASLRGRAQVYDVLGEFDSARADYESALESARSAGNRVDEWRLLIDLGLLWQSRDLASAGEYYQRALELAHHLGDSSLLAYTLNRVGNWHFNRGRVREALPLHREALELFRKLDDRRGMAQTMDLLGIVSYQLGEAIQGAAYLGQAVPIWRALDDRQGLVNSMANLTMRALVDTEVLGDVNYTQLTNQSDEALEIAHSFHWDQEEALALMQGAISLRQASTVKRLRGWHELDRW